MNLKNFLLKVAIFFIIAIVIDFALGAVFSYMVNNSKGGDNGRNNYICNLTSEDILVFGSSRAIHHYNPTIITDSLGLSCYNCGQDGNGVILNYGRYQLIAQRYHPKMVIYDVSPQLDLHAGEDNHKYLGWLRAYYDRPGIAEIFESVDKTEKLKMLSRMYRYNSKFVQIITDYIHPLESDGINGFRPNEAELDTLKIARHSFEEGSYEYDSLKLKYLNKMLDTAPDVRFVFVVSPYWYGADTASFAPLKQLCEQRHIPLIDFSNNPKYVHHNEFFSDGAHLNARGADEFTRDIVKQIKALGVAGKNPAVTIAQ